MSESDFHQSQYGAQVALRCDIDELLSRGARLVAAAQADFVHAGIGSGTRSSELTFRRGLVANRASEEATVFVEPGKSMEVPAYTYLFARKLKGSDDRTLRFSFPGNGRVEVSARSFPPEMQLALGKNALMITVEQQDAYYGWGYDDKPPIINRELRALQWATRQFECLYRDRKLAWSLGYAARKTAGLMHQKRLDLISLSKFAPGHVPGAADIARDFWRARGTPNV